MLHGGEHALITAGYFDYGKRHAEDGLDTLRFLRVGPFCIVAKKLARAAAQDTKRPWPPISEVRNRLTSNRSTA